MTFLYYEYLQETVFSKTLQFPESNSIRTVMPRPASSKKKTSRSGEMAMEAISDFSLSSMGMHEKGRVLVSSNSAPENVKSTRKPWMLETLNNCIPLPVKFLSLVDIVLNFVGCRMSAESSSMLGNSKMAMPEIKCCYIGMF